MNCTCSCRPPLVYLKELLWQIWPLAFSFHFTASLFCFTALFHFEFVKSLFLRSFWKLFSICFSVLVLDMFSFQLDWIQLCFGGFSVMSQVHRRLLFFRLFSVYQEHSSTLGCRTLFKLLTMSCLFHFGDCPTSDLLRAEYTKYPHSLLLSSRSFTS